jgi:Subtilase family
MGRESFSIRNRSEFDDFWMSGLVLGQRHPFEVLESRTKTAAEAQSTIGASEFQSPADEPPVTAQVWWTYATEPLDSAIDLLIDPGAAVASPNLNVHPGTGSGPVAVPPSQNVNPGLSSGAAVRVIQKHLINEDDVSLESTELAEGFGCIAIKLTYEDMVTRLLPLTSWRELVKVAKTLSRDERRSALRAYQRLDPPDPGRRWIGWFLHLLAVCGHRTSGGSAVITYGAKSPALETINRLLDGVQIPTTSKPIGRITLNRRVKATVSRSMRTVKVDAARELFGIRCDTIRWAVVDSGIDARHDWFRRLRPDGTRWAQPFENDGRPFNFTRIIEAYDFTKQRTSGAMAQRQNRGDTGYELPGDVPISLDLGQRFYEPPRYGHGTHVAGIIGGYGGLCPDIGLYDYRVLDEEGRGNEFAVVSALRHILGISQRVSHADPTGRTRDMPIHGVNLSIGLDADVTSDACGWSLVCRACDELVRAGVLVVTSAGNTGFEDQTGALISTGRNYRTVSITDPGNTERVITVGATDADRPREYGVSYFSARGPTADGRAKPDLVAPGNSITSAYGYKTVNDDRPNAAATLNGTSMAAAHVSGCAALLMARHRELIGKPDEVKRILMETATDLQRDHNFQGAGLVDALRAVQSL